MAHITSIGAGIFSDLSVACAATPPTFASLDTAAEFQALFTSMIESIGGTKAPGTYVRIHNIRSFPAMGTPPNIVKVPIYGQKISQQIQGQADAPQMEIEMNFVPADWAQETGNILGLMVGDGNQYVFRFSLLNSQPTVWDSDVGGLGAVPNSQYYWIGKIEALEVTPQLTDANTAKITITIQSSFFGAYTI
jgi:hypothetical protein